MCERRLALAHHVPGNTDGASGSWAEPRGSYDLTRLCQNVHKLLAEPDQTVQIIAVPGSPSGSRKAGSRLPTQDVLRFGFRFAPQWGDNGLDCLLSPELWRAAVQVGHEHAGIRGDSFKAFSDRGGYPIAQEKHETPWHEPADYLNKTVIRRAIQHDLRIGPRGQKRDGTLLVRLVQPIELRLKRKKAPAKLCLSDHTLRASWLQEVVPLDPTGLVASPHVPNTAGRLAESTLGYFPASIPSMGGAHFPMRGSEPEVDFVLTVGTKRIPIEVKYRRRIDPMDDTQGLRAFLEKTVSNAPLD